VEVSGLLNVYLVFYVLLLELFTTKGLILYLDTLITDTLRSYRDDVYKVEELLERRLNENNI
jgi:hypothetical protein